MMTVYLFSNSYEIGEIINDHLLSHNYLSFLFQKKDQITTAIKERKKLPDLLILDYKTFNHDFFNIYLHLNEQKVELPVIFFNDPCLTASTRTKHWLYQLEILTYRSPYKNYSDEERDKYQNLFKCIEEIIELEELKPYISLMQKPEPLPDSFKKKVISIDYIKSNNSSIIDFKNRVNLQNRLFYLLQIFYKNKESQLTLKDILNLYKKDEKRMTENSLKVLISNLRTEIRKDKNCNFFISNNKGAYSFIEN